MIDPQLFPLGTQLPSSEQVIQTTIFQGQPGSLASKFSTQDKQDYKY